MKKREIESTVENATHFTNVSKSVRFISARSLNKVSDIYSVRKAVGKIIAEAEAKKKKIFLPT